MAYDWLFEFEEPGTYTFGVHYDIEVNGFGSVINSMMLSLK